MRGIWRSEERFFCFIQQNFFKWIASWPCQKRSMVGKKNRKFELTKMRQNRSRRDLTLHEFQLEFAMTWNLNSPISSELICHMFDGASETRRIFKEEMICHQFKFEVSMFAFPFCSTKIISFYDPRQIDDSRALMDFSRWAEKFPVLCWISRKLMWQVVVVIELHWCFFSTYNNIFCIFLPFSFTRDSFIFCNFTLHHHFVSVDSFISCFS